MNPNKKALAAGAASIVLAASGALPAFAAPNATGGSLANRTPVGSIFSGTVEAASGGGFLVGKRRRGDASAITLIAVDVDAATIASKAGLEIPLEEVPAGATIIVSGTKNADGSVLASKIIVRK